MLTPSDTSFQATDLPRSIRTGLTADEIQQAFRRSLRCGMRRLETSATKHDLYAALALTVYVPMAHFACVGSHTINGVVQLHSDRSGRQCCVIRRLGAAKILQHQIAEDQYPGKNVQLRRACAYTPLLVISDIDDLHTSASMAVISSQAAGRFRIYCEDKQLPRSRRPSPPASRRDLVRVPLADITDCHRSVTVDRIRSLGSPGTGIRCALPRCPSRRCGTGPGGPRPRARSR